MMSRENYLKLKAELKHHAFASRGRLIILFEDDNLAFTPDEVLLAVVLWDKGEHVRRIAEKLERTEKETVALIVDLIYSGRIKKRPGAFAGKEWGGNRCRGRSTAI